MSHNIFIFVLIITVKLLWLTSIRARFCATTQNFLLLLLLLIHTRASNPIVSCIVCREWESSSVVLLLIYSSTEEIQLLRASWLGFCRCKQAISWLLFCLLRRIRWKSGRKSRKVVNLRWNSETWLFSLQLHNKLILKIYQISHFYLVWIECFCLRAETTFDF